MTYLLIAINVIVSLIGFSRMNHVGGGSKFLFSPYEVASGRNYEGMLLSHFSHADGAHLLFNMITLYYFGPVVEAYLSVWTMLLIYAGAGAVSTLFVYHRHREDPGYRALGASDSVSGILFAAIVLQPGMHVYFVFIPFPIPAPLFAIGYIVVSTLFMQRGGGRIGGRISHEAHLAGAFTGLILAGLLSPDGFDPLLRSIRFLIT